MYAQRTYSGHYTELIDEALLARLPVSHLRGADRLNETVYSAIFPGGKRMRPLLVLLAAGVCGGSAADALPAAVAIEFLHAASLILDDLPAMDDADTRRGLGTVHRRFGEDFAILAALSLLNEAYGIFGGYPGLLEVAVREIGSRGMIGGQAADLSGADEQSRLEKTTALLRLAMAAGAACANAAAIDTEELMSFGEELGELYQTCDDLLDDTATVESCGKTIGQDSRHCRMNITARHGYEATLERVQKLAEAALARLRGHFGCSVPLGLLENLVSGVVERGMQCRQ